MNALLSSRTETVKSQIKSEYSGTKMHFYTIENTQSSSKFSLSTSNIGLFVNTRADVTNKNKFR